MNPKDDAAGVTTRVEQEHVHLRKALEELKLFSSAVATKEDFATWRLEMIWQVRDFKNDLLKHFDLEEEGGFMRDVRRLVPNSDRQIKELLEEHQQMESSLDRILSTLKSMQDRNEDDLRRLQDEISDFATTILDHESTEQHLMQRTYYRDYGGPE